MSIVYVGLSGGVDSAVSAALLKEKGHTVVGAFIKIWRPEFAECPWREDRLDAMRVAASLNIRFKEIDLSEKYKQSVIDDMVENYARGITPNPDVLCNRHIKFGAFAKWALHDGADFVATGHYARTERNRLLRGVDQAKDQSYFLWQLTASDLEHVMFPVGALTKAQVREKARRLRLPNATKQDSQGLCFVGDVTMRDFLGQYMALHTGRVLNEEGAVIGEHDGAALYTVGERHGFRINHTTPNETPYFVIAVDTLVNTITVSHRVSAAHRLSTRLIDAVWHARPEPDKTYTAQARYRETPAGCTVRNDVVTFTAPHGAPRGQSLVVYDGDLVIGGGIISATA